MKILILGSGQLASAIKRHYPSQVFLYSHSSRCLPSYQEKSQLRDTLLFYKREFSVDVVINTRALVSVDLCEQDRAKADYLNSFYPEIVAVLCGDLDLRHVLISTDHVYSGSMVLNKECDANPQNYYAESKLNGESRVMTANSNSLILRANSLAWGTDTKPSFVYTLYKTLMSGDIYSALTDAIFSPSSPSSLLNCIVALLSIDQSGIFNHGLAQPLSKYEFALSFKNILQNISPHKEIGDVRSIIASVLKLKP